MSWDVSVPVGVNGLKCFPQTFIAVSKTISTVKKRDKAANQSNNEFLEFKRRQGWSWHLTTSKGIKDIVLQKVRETWENKWWKFHGLVSRTHESAGIILAIIIMIYRKHIHIVAFLSDSWSNWNLRMLVFEERGNRSNRRKTSRSKGEKQQITQPTYGVDARPHCY